MGVSEARGIWWLVPESYLCGGLSGHGVRSQGESERGQ